MIIARISSRWGKITIVLIICCCGMVAEGKYGGGSGEPNDPYLISDANHMQAIGADSNDWDKCFKLMDDIDLSQFDGKDGREEFNLIGVYVDWEDPNNKPFTGVFDGNNRTISSFTYDSNDIKSVGFFGFVHEGKIQNLGLIDPNVAGTVWHVGSLVGWLRDGTITGCYIEGGSVKGTYSVGGLVGRNEGGRITNCYSASSVSGTSSVGGLVGDSQGGLTINPVTITDCYSAGLVTGSDLTGGLIGVATGDGTISNCFSSADVYGDLETGGLIGARNLFPLFLGQSTLSNCYAVGNVYGYEDAGGLVGGNIGDLPISYCYAAGIVQGTYRVGGLVGDNYTQIINSYATGNVTGVDWVGGLVGWNFDVITICYSTGKVDGTGDYIGGLVGENGLLYMEPECNDGVITNSYWNAETSGEPNMCGSQAACSSGCDPNYGKTTAQMQIQQTFENWDFIKVWSIGKNQTYPYLRICLAGDINHDGIVTFENTEMGGKERNQ